MSKPQLADLNLLDDFLFGKMVTYPVIGEQFSRNLIKIILKKNYEKLKVIPQRVYYGSNKSCHGARLDVYLEDDSTASMMFNDEAYDVEVSQKLSKSKIASLPQRVRFYHARIDAGSIKVGESYEKLKNVYVIMITSDDPFGMDHMIYTIKNQCIEIPDMSYEDGARTIFLYTRGTQGDSTEALRQFLHYMEHTTKENANNEELQAIQEMVEVVKMDEEVELEFMKWSEHDEIVEERGIEKGIQQGIQQGIALVKKIREQSRQGKTVSELAAKYQMSEKDIQALLK